MFNNLATNGLSTPVEVTGPLTLFATGDSVWGPDTKVEVLICDDDADIQKFAPTGIVFENDGSYYLPTTGTFFITARMTGATDETDVTIRKIG